MYVFFFVFVCVVHYNRCQTFGVEYITNILYYNTRNSVISSNNHIFIILSGWFACI